MDYGIKGKRALVTGAGRGIGKAIALSLSREGAQVAVLSRTESELKEVVKEMGSESSGHSFIVSDLTGKDEPGRVLSELEKNFGEPDILVNNLGGTLGITDPFCSLEDWRKVYRMNLEVAIELSGLAIPHMRKKKWGRIVNISSISALENHGPVTYCVAKAGLIAYTRSMGRILAADGVVMSTVLPGAIFTENGYWDMASRERPEHVEKYLRDRMAIKRFGKPDEVSDVVTFLCSEKPSFFVGSSIVVDGGQGRSFFAV